MGFTYETQGTSTFLVYGLEEKEQLDSMIMGMMGNNRIEGVLPFSFTRQDRDRIIKYNVSSRVNLEQYFNGIVNKKRLLKVLTSMASAVLEAENYMLEPEVFVWDKRYIFVDVSTSQAELICLPVLQETGKKTDLEAIFKEMFFGVQFDQTENCDYVARLLGFFNASTHFSLQEFVNLLKDIDRQKAEEVKKEISEQSVSVQQPATSLPPVNGMADSQTGQAELPTENVSENRQISGALKPVVIQSSPDVARQSSQKKGFHLFEKKEKKEKQPRPQKVKPAKGTSVKDKQALPGRSTGIIPGQLQMPGSVSIPVPDMQNTQQNPQQSSEKQGIGNAYVTPAYNVQKGTFGGTVVLNAGNKGQGTVVLNAQNAAPALQSPPYLQRLKNGEKLFVNKGVIKIGSDASYADYVVSDNKAVSRSHAEIRLKGANVYLVDSNSTNHTYVGNKMLVPNVEELLKEGSSIRLADEEFEFHMS